MSEDLTKSGLRLRTMLTLRWFAVAGQSLAVLFVSISLGFKLPLIACLGVIALSALINVIFTFQFKDIKLLSENMAAWMLTYDIGQLTALLALTGGIENPFVCLLIAPVAVSASTLRPRSTFIIAMMALIAATLLTLVYLPLPQPTSGLAFIPHYYRLGLWLAVLCAIIFVGFYAWKIADENRQMARALTATEMVLAREQKLSALDGLAAAAAHGLGTPLSTISLTAKEVKRDLPEDSNMAEDVSLIISQAIRCREILQNLIEQGTEGDLFIGTSSLSDFMAEVLQPHQALYDHIDLTCEPQTGTSPPFDREPVVERNAGVIYGLGNLIENAIDFADKQVTIKALWSDQHIEITIMDDGEGFSLDLLNRLGEPFVSTRAIERQNLKEADESGMGLGFFIAKTLLERSGAEVTYGNRDAPNHGACIQLRWLRQKIDHSFGT